MENSPIIQLEQQIAELVKQYEKLKRDYAVLENANASLERECKVLLENNFLASQKIESMIKRLKDMEKENE